jgi:uncharacterized protein YjiS (DUF1127 family)
MSAPIAKSEFVFKLASSQSYIGPDYDPTPLPAPRASGRPAGGRIAAALALLVTAVRNWFEKHATLAEMQRMSDRELADIGLTRGDLPRIFDAAFAADHARSRITH